jgi:hypothetical protein
MRFALIQPHHEDRRSVAKRSCKRRDNTERQTDQNASVLISSVVALSCWLATNLPLLPVLSFLTLFYGNAGTKFRKNFQKTPSAFRRRARQNAFRRRDPRQQSRLSALGINSPSPSSRALASVQSNSVVTENGRRFLLLFEAVGVLIRYLR